MSHQSNMHEVGSSRDGRGDHKNFTIINVCMFAHLSILALLYMGLPSV
jgi:hypothetical protein